MTRVIRGDLTYYDILGVSRSASPEEIKAAYREAALHLHPDKTHGASSCNPAHGNAFSRLHTAWQVLKDADLKAAYDKQLDGEGHKGGVFISNEVDLDDMQHSVSQSGGSSFLYPCRCGEAFICREDDLTETADSLLVQCQGCSLVIMVLYTVAGDT